jgi:DNA-binding transcriptional MerR regulator
MKTWYIKEFSRLVDVSVRTLHYYDKIGLLTPSIRRDNDYRLYSERDLLKLQQIIALKYFGFDLRQIKSMLEGSNDLFAQFSSQTKMLKQKAETLQHASNLLDELINKSNFNKSIEWQQLIKMIEVFKMTQQLEHSWVNEIFSNDELQEYAEFENKMKQGSKETFERRWHSLVDEINKLSGKVEPYSKEGIEMGKRFMAWTNEVYGKEHAHLRTKKFEQGFGEGMGLDDIGMSKESFEWLSIATDAYWRDRLLTILNQVDELPESEILALWNQAMDDMYGNEEKRKSELVEIAINDKETPKKAIPWLKQLL